MSAFPSLLAILGVVVAIVTVGGLRHAVLGAPLEDISSRPQLLTFGLHVTQDPATNPIDPPERFTGYHTALDFEILPGEEETEVPVYAACDGEVLMASNAEGYGGVIAHRCVVNGEDVTVLYGHIDPASFAVQEGGSVTRGQRIAVLAPHKSAGSGNTRKHLHFGVHRGRDPVLLGYVQSEQELGGFINPKTLLP